MTKRKIKSVQSGTCQWLDLNTSLLGDIESEFGFIEPGFLQVELNKLCHRFQSLLFLESIAVSNTDIRYVLQVIKKRSESFLIKISPFLKDKKLLSSRLYYFKKELAIFLRVLDLIQSKVASQLARHTGEQSCHLLELGWPNRRNLLTENIRYLYRLSDFHSRLIPENHLEPLVQHVNKLEGSIAIIEELIKRAQYAMEKIPPQKKGKRERIPINYYIAELSRIYQEGTSNKPSSYWNNYTNDYSGDFLKFVVQISAIFGFKFISPGKLIKNILKRVRSKK